MRAPLKELKVNIEPVQDLHGYDHPWPAGGGKNKLPPMEDASETAENVTATRNDDGSISFSGTSSQSVAIKFKEFKLPAGEYRFSAVGSTAISENAGFNDYIRDLDNSVTLATIKLNNITEASFTLTQETNVRHYCIVNSGATVSGKLYAMIRLASETDATFAPYENLCPIEGFDKVDIPRMGKNLLRIAESEMIVAGWDRLFPVNLKAGSYTLSCQNSISASGRIGCMVYLQDNSRTGYIIRMATSYNFGRDNNSIQFVLSEEQAEQVEYIRFCMLANGSTFDVFENANIQIELGSTATDYAPYSGQIYEVTLPSEAGTVYGGSLTVSKDGTGKLVVDRATLTKNTADMNNSESYPGWENAGIKALVGAELAIPIASILNIGTQFSVNTRGSNDTLYLSTITYGKTQTEWITEGIDVQIVVPLATPQTYTLTASQVRTLLGTNNIWSDAGSIELSYWTHTS